MADDLHDPRDLERVDASRAKAVSRSPFRNKGWTVSTHYFPPSALRSYHSLPPSLVGNPPTASTGRKSPAALKAGVQALFALRESGLHAVSLPGESLAPLIAVNRYYMANGTSHGSTIITCHGAGLHKETWEPALSVIVDQIADCTEIWSLDAFSHGESRGAGGYLVTADWVDLARDVETFIKFYLPRSGAPIQSYLERNHGSTIRPRLVGIGHSIGANTIAHAATLLPPATFSSLVLIEPAIFNSTTDDMTVIRQIFPWLSRGALGKRQVWSGGRPSVAQLKKDERRLYGKWDDEAARIFCEFGIEGGGGRIEARLKMRGSAEALLFACPRDSTVAFPLLPRLSPLLNILVVYGSDSFIPVDGTSWMPHKNLRRALGHCRTTEMTLQGLGHGLVQENPVLVGAQLAKWLAAARGHGLGTARL